VFAPRARWAATRRVLTILEVNDVRGMNHINIGALTTPSANATQLGKTAQYVDLIPW